MAIPYEEAKRRAREAGREATKAAQAVLIEAATAGMTPEQRAAFDALVEEYRYCAMLRARAAYVSYAILGDLVRAGWRRSAPGELPKGPPA